MLDNFSLEEISTGHYDAYKEYYKELLYRNYSFFEAHLKEYDQYRQLNNIKDLLNKNYKPALFREFLLFKKDDNKIIGNIDLWLCPIYKQKTVLELVYNIAEGEQHKGYGKILLLLFLRNNPLDVNSFLARIDPENTDSLSLIKHFRPIEMGTFKYTPDVKLTYFEIPNKAMRKRLQKNE